MCKYLEPNRLSVPVASTFPSFSFTTYFVDILLVLLFISISFVSSVITTSIALPSHGPSVANLVTGLQDIANTRWQQYRQHKMATVTKEKNIPHCLVATEVPNKMFQGCGHNPHVKVGHVTSFHESFSLIPYISVWYKRKHSWTSPTGPERRGRYIYMCMYVCQN